MRGERRGCYSFLLHTRTTRRTSQSVQEIGSPDRTVGLLVQFNESSRLHTEAMATSTAKRGIDVSLRCLRRVNGWPLRVKTRSFHAQAGPALFTRSRKMNSSRSLSTETIAADNSIDRQIAVEVVSTHKGGDVEVSALAKGATLATRKKPVNGYLNKVRVRNSAAAL